MDLRKIYSYYKLDPIDIIESIEWAQEHFSFYDGEVSPLWNQHVQHEFARLNAQRNMRNQQWKNLFEAIANDMLLQPLNE